ncbi:hypothetical protein JCM19037_632 [Geomicrobium sp. JCM 19037]|nr:hypothetical protein JCM19037_632 [Geomicrobium sp. JCM 19037]
MSTQSIHENQKNNKLSICILPFLVQYRQEMAERTVRVTNGELYFSKQSANPLLVFADRLR